MDAAGGWQHGALKNPLFFKAREQIGQQLRFNAEIFALLRIEPRGRVKRHRNEIIAVHVKHDMAEDFEVLADLAILVDVIKARENLDDWATFCRLHFWQ